MYTEIKAERKVRRVGFFLAAAVVAFAIFAGVSIIKTRTAERYRAAGSADISVSSILMHTNDPIGGSRTVFIAANADIKGLTIKAKYFDFEQSKNVEEIIELGDLKAHEVRVVYMKKTGTIEVVSGKCKK